jgi:hypothetical protein
MKRANKVLTPALFAIGAVAQSGSSILGSSTLITNPSDTGVVYETYSICPSAEVTTVTGPTSTYCPGPYCNGAPTDAPGAGSSTVWVTEMVTYCPTATDEAGWLTTMTTTITEPCPCSGETHTPGYVPAGHTTAVVTCTVCGEDSPVATIITPVATGANAYAYATASAGAAAGAGSGSGSPGSGPGSSSNAGASAGAAAGAGAGVGSASGSPGSGSGPGSDSNAQASPAAAAGASSPNGAAAPSSSNAAEYAPASGAGSNNTFTPPMSPSAGSGMGSSASGISPPIAVQSHSGGARSGIDMVGASLVCLAGLVGGLAWQL